MSSNLNQITVIIKSPPLGQISGKEGVDLALVCAAFEMPVNLIFVDHGIFHLLNNQQTSAFLDKNHNKQLQALEYYDIEPIYVESESLSDYSLEPNQLITNTKLLSRCEINQFIKASQQTYSF